MVIALMLTTLVIAPTSRAGAWGVDAPDTGILRLRYGTDGQTTIIPLQAYFTTPQSNPTMVIYNAEYKPGNISEPSCEGSKSVYMHAGAGAGQSWKCNSYNSKTITLPATTPASGLPGWYVSDATVSMIPQSGKNFKDDCKGNSNSDGGGCDAKFTIHLNGPSDSVLSINASTNKNGFDQWGASYYSLKFGPPPGSCNNTNGNPYIGVYDPDSNFTMKLYHLKPNGGRNNLIGTHNIPKNDKGDYKFYYDFVQGEKYELELTGVDDGDTIVPYFPFPTVYGQISPSPCPPPDTWRIPYFRVNDGDLFSNSLPSHFTSLPAGHPALNANAMGIRTNSGLAGGNLGAISRSNIQNFTSGQGNSLTMKNYPRDFDLFQNPAAPSKDCPWDNNVIDADGAVIIGGQVPPGYHNCVFTHPVKITSNITYTDTAFKLNDVHVLKIYSPTSITISIGVTQVNAVLVSGYKLLSCGDPNEAPMTNVNNCQTNQTLVINGAILAKKLRLYRNIPYTYPANPAGAYNETIPAEIFNFTPESWLDGLSGEPSVNSAYDAYTIMPPIL